MFETRISAGKELAKELPELSNNAMVFGITRGGIVPAAFVAAYHDIPLYGLVIKKISHPQNRELALGAIGPEHAVYWDERHMKHQHVSSKEKQKLLETTEKERKALEKELGISSYPKLRGKTIVLVDDGVATGATIFCAYAFLQQKHPKEIILAVPVISQYSFAKVSPLFHQIIALEIPDEFEAVGQFYEEFDQIENDQVKELLKDNSNEYNKTQKI